MAQFSSASRTSRDGRIQAGGVILALLLLATPAWAVDPAPRPSYPTPGLGGSVIGTVPMGLDVNGFAIPCGSSTVVTGCGIGGTAAYVADPNNAAFQGETAMTVGTTYAAARSIKATCTVAGNVALTYVNASVGIWQVVVGQQTIPAAVTAVNTSGTTATCTYGNLL